MLRKSLLLLIPAIALGGCGATKSDRALSGAGIGAATGAVVGAVTGLSVAQGVLLGAAGGAITGLATDKSQVDLGDPVWKKNPTSQAAAIPASSRSTGAADSGTVRSIQRGLVKLGFDPGPVDGITGPKTRNAIRSYQRQYGLLVDGQPSKELASHIQQQGLAHNSL